MPEVTGVWKYTFKNNNVEISGSFECVEASGNNHGPVKTREDQFCYVDDSRYIYRFGQLVILGQTNQPIDMQERTLQTLKNSPFNKVCMGIFPKSMPYNTTDPEYFPFLKNSDNSWNFDKLDYRFWDNFELRVSQLDELGIEVDLILFHPYDRWGFASMSQEASLKYLEYVVARFAAYKNIWWSLANEYELLYDKSEDNWDEYGKFIQSNDPYGHLISIHNVIKIYPKKEWMSHLSLQTIKLNQIPVWKEEYELPVIIDECGYEGNLEFN